MAGFNSNLEISPYTFDEVSKPKPRPFEFNYGEKTEQPKAQAKTKIEVIDEGLRSVNSNLTKSRMKAKMIDIAAQGFKPIFSAASKPISSQPQGIFNPTEYKALADADLYKTKNNSAAELQYNLDVLKQYTPKANDESNRALGNELATRLPYSSFEQNLTSMRQAGVNAANMTNSISGAYNSSVSKLNPVSMSL